MALGRSTLEILRATGWHQVSEIPAAAMERLENESHQRKEQNRDSALQFITEIYEIFYNETEDRYMIVTDGGGYLTTNAPGIVIVTASNEDEKHPYTKFFTIGLDDKTVGNWLIWVAAQKCNPDTIPCRGFDYVS